MMARQDTPQPDSLLYHPLTHPQKRVWYLEKLYPNTSLYNLGGPSRLKGEVDFDLLEEAINIFVQRNDALRLRFIEEGGEGKQYVAAFQRFTVPHFDFSGAANPEEEFTAWAEAELGKPFPLINSNLHYFAFFRIGPQNTGLLVKFHHLISDGWSIKVANEQVYGVYQKLLAGEAVPAESEPSYLEYISSEQNYLNSERFLKDRTFWMEKFRDLPEPVFTQSSENLAGRRVAYQLDNALSERIRDFITSRKCSLNTFYTSLFLIYLSKFSGQEDLIIGTPVLNRAGRKERSMFGMFTSTMPFRFFVDPLLSASKMLEAVNQELAGYYFHQKYPYDLFFQDLELKKKGYDSLFQVCVNYYNTKFDAVVNGEVVRNSELYNGNQFYSFQMIIKEWLGEGQITLEFDYKPDLYTGEQVDRIFTYLLQLTEQILADPSGTVKRLEMLPEAEKNRQVHVFNSTERDYPKGQTIIQLFEAQCAQTPTKPAVSFGELHLTYRELNRLANGLANELKMKGVVQNSIVGLLVNHSLETLIAILAVLKAGAAYLPIDPAYPSDRIEYMLVDSGCRVLLTNCLDSLGGVDLKTIFTGEVVPLVYDELPLGEDQNLKPTYGPRDPVYLIYTSGSTGKPKGVIIEHQGLVNYIWWARKVYVKGPEDVFALYSSLSFDLTVTSIFTPLVGGNRIIIYRDDGPEYVLYRIMKENQATIVKLTPSHLSLIKDQENRHSVVRCFIVGGEDLKVNLANTICQSFGGKIEIYNEYGPTETVVGCMIHLFDPAEDTQVSVPIGIPADNVQIYLLASDLSLLPPGAAGEMYISGDGVARGYLNRPELTAEKFVSNPFISVSDGVFHVETAPPQEGIHETSLQKTPQRRMYRTGDLARFLDNGKIEYLGRVDQQVKIHGYRIELGEIERQLMSHESIQDAVVIDRQLANGDKYLCGYVTIKDDSAAEVFGAGRPGIPEIKNDLRKVLPEYMIPKYLMVIDEIPLTANGKVNRKLLPEPLMDEENAIEYVAPGNEIERTLVHLAGETLGIPQIGMKHNFFHYGGDSIKAIQIASKLNELGLKIRVRDILSHPVLEEMARCVESDAGLIDQAPRSGAFRPTPIYAWFLSLMLPKPDYYNQSVILSWKQKITVEDLEVIMDALVQHHDSLRLNYDQATGRLYYCDDLLQQKYQVQYYDLASAPPGEQDEQVRKFSEALKAGFTLERGFLIKTCLFDLGPRGRKVLITAHHLVVDGVSWRILLNDVYRCYQQIRANQPVSLPPKTHSLQEWAGELEEYSTGGANQEKAYWKGTLQNKFTFPPEFDRGEERIAFRQEVTLRLSPEETGQLLLQANTSFGTEPQELLITALILAIGDYTGRQEIMIELEGHGREEIFKNIDLTRTVGWFTSLYPVAFRITGSGLAAQIKEVKEGLRRVPNKGVGFGILRNYCEMTGYESRRSIRFNYLGDFSAIYENECFQYLDEDTGPDSSPSNPLTALIDINALVVEKMLKISLAYSSNKFSPKTMETVAGKFKARLLEIIRFCCNQGSVELTASDFTMVKLDQDDLESLLE